MLLASRTDDTCAFLFFLYFFYFHNYYQSFKKGFLETLKFFMWDGKLCFQKLGKNLSILKFLLKVFSFSFFFVFFFFFFFFRLFCGERIHGAYNLRVVRQLMWRSWELWYESWQTCQRMHFCVISAFFCGSYWMKAINGTSVVILMMHIPSCTFDAVIVFSNCFVYLSPSSIISGELTHL